MRAVIGVELECQWWRRRGVLCKSCVWRAAGGVVVERKNLIKANDIKKLCVRVIRASLEILAYLQYQSVH
jgi:hypothetical protein